MSNTAEIIIKLDAKGQREVQAALNSVRKDTGKLDKSVGTLDKSSVGLASTFAKTLGPAIVGLGVISLAKDVVEVTSRFESLNASLITVTGSQDAANKNFAWLREFASQTPFQLDQVVEAFIKMESLGLNPTRESLRSFGNTSSAMGKDLNQMVEAVADATTGEFERLRDFGITTKTEGDKVKITFRGVTTTVQKNAAEIGTYLQQLGEVHFADGMNRQMETIAGATSNLGDNWDHFLVSLGNLAPITGAVKALATLTNQVTELIAPTLRGQIAGLDNEIMQLGMLMNEQEELAMFSGASAQLEGLQRQMDELMSKRDVLQGDLDEIVNAGGGGGLGGEDEVNSSFTPNQDTVALGIAEGNATDDDMWLRRVGLDAEAIEREKTARFEIQEWRREQDLLEAEEMTDNWLIRDTLMSDAVTRELEMLQLQADERVRIESETNAMILSMKMGNINAALSLMQMFAGKSKAFAIGALVLQKGLAIAEVFISTQAAAAAALEKPPVGLGPIAGIPAAAAIEAQGKIRMGLIAATGLAEAVTSGGGGGSSGGAPYSPMGRGPSQEAVQRGGAQETSPQYSISVNILGAVYGTESKELADSLSRELVTSLEEAKEYGVH